MGKKIDWEKANWKDTDFHPHRKVVVDIVKSFNPESILELGCGWGNNLRNIKIAIPDIKAVGTDINLTRMQQGMSKIRGENLDVRMVEQNIKNIDYSPNSFDVVLTDAVLLMIELTEEELKKIFMNMKRIAKKAIVLVEWHDEEIKDLTGKNIGFRFVRNYKKLLEPLNAKSIEMRKITPEEWDSTNWKTFGYYITIKL